MDRCNENAPFTHIVEDISDERAAQLRALADETAPVVWVDDVRQMSLDLELVAV